jgi:hypothetical protein
MVGPFQLSLHFVELGIHFFSWLVHKIVERTGNANLIAEVKYLLRCQRITAFIDLQDVLVLSFELLLCAIINLLAAVLLQPLQKLLLSLSHVGL